MYTDFIALLNSIKRKGITNFYKWLRCTDFFMAPASTASHGACAGGLLSHSVGVARILLTLTTQNNISWQMPDSPIIVGLFHDLCKTNLYKQLIRNVRDTSGTWKQIPYYTIDEEIPLGHGEKSVILLGQYLPLTQEEIYCIRWHMSSFDAREDRIAAEKAISLCPQILWTRTADRLEAHCGNRRTVA